mmetsp:Transcript_17302/g.50296  ORF Transcript_17302/g.50296 Transcript_17302/m.50296 type:complete len:314 (-) Transcript_17302:278-1219(-)
MVAAFTLILAQRPLPQCPRSIRVPQSQFHKAIRMTHIRVGRTQLESSLKQLASPDVVSPALLMEGPRLPKVYRVRAEGNAPLEGGAGGISGRRIIIVIGGGIGALLLRRARRCRTPSALPPRLQSREREVGVRVAGVNVVHDPAENSRRLAPSTKTLQVLGLPKEVPDAPLLPTSVSTAASASAPAASTSAPALATAPAGDDASARPLVFSSVRALIFGRRGLGVCAGPGSARGRRRHSGHHPERRRRTYRVPHIIRCRATYPQARRRRRRGGGGSRSISPSRSVRPSATAVAKPRPRPFSPSAASSGRERLQ